MNICQLIKWQYNVSRNQYIDPVIMHNTNTVPHEPTHRLKMCKSTVTWDLPHNNNTLHKTNNTLHKTNNTLHIFAVRFRWHSQQGVRCTTTCYQRPHNYLSHATGLQYKENIHHKLILETSVIKWSFSKTIFCIISQ